MSNDLETAARAKRAYGAPDDRGPTTPPPALPHLRGNEESWVSLPADKTKSPIVQAGDLKESNGTIQQWDGTTPLLLVLPDGSDIRSIYFPNIPNPVTVFPGAASATANGLWTTSESSEVVLLPSTHQTVTLTASKAFGETVQVYATHDILSPIAPYVTIVGDLATVATSDYPQGAVPFTAPLFGQWSTGSYFTNFNTPSLNAGQSIYITKLFVRGLERQTYAYSLTVLDPADNVIFSWTFSTGCDQDSDFSPPKQVAPSTHAGVWQIQLTSAIGDAIVGDLNYDAFVLGYYL